MRDTSKEALITHKGFADAHVHRWCTTDRWDAENPAHQKIRENILVGNGLPSLMSTEEVLQSLVDAGWDIVDYADLAEPHPQYPVPWYQPFDGSYSLESFRTSWLGIQFTNAFVYLLETLRLAPKGTIHTQQFLVRGAQGLLEGGRTRTFTPMFFFRAR